MAVRIGAKAGPGVKTVRLLGGTVTPMCSPTLLGDGPPLLSPQDLLQYKLLHAHEHRPWCEWFEDRGVADDAVAQGPVFDDTNRIYAAVLSGQGGGLIHTALVSEEIAAGLLVIPFPAESGGDMGYHVHFRSDDAAQPRVSEFLAWLTASADPHR